ncbi:MAG: hypothetical protein KF799_12825 [Bdellovibrionales bacterium]|nr:hypothetical protein [Bdellovibrionales bacterium]
MTAVCRRNIVTGLIILTACLSTACSLSLGGGSRIKGKAILERPTLNQATDVTLQNRSCLFLTKQLQGAEVCSISVLADLSLLGKQLDDQEASFTLLTDATDLKSPISKSAQFLGDTIQFVALKEGDIYSFKKSDTHFAYELVFQIIKIDADQISLRYEVISFNQR